MAATIDDIAIVRSWFKNERDLMLWGGVSMQHCNCEQSFVSTLSKDNFISYSLSTNKRLLGFAQIQQHPQKRVHLGRLAIKPNLRGQGLSHVLLAHLFTAAKKQFKANQASLFVYLSNTYAHNAYMKNGFVSTPLPKGMPTMQGCDYMLKRL